ncbi:SPW repeat protein [Streptomyces chiangmaiensis]|uniref:SPW repeat protein n=1 Tax=Streptomyces chiangmaiensis TaxID=766497 RepID=A0ABU7FCF1_9ACTN|nr:SPW repeat protein [Streptomyces chiangmaiensis]MED7821847.1 SPW repeat protein [Streptomyces chiangmaiensis]
MSYARQPSGMGTHPELAEMRERLERTASSGSAIAIEGLILLAGAYTAISPWVVHFSGAEPNLTINNLIVGITVGLIGLGLTLAPDRMFRLAWVVVPLGVWLLISPWVVTAAHGAGAGIIWNNCVVGAVTALLGLAAMGLTIGVTRRRTPTTA